MRCDRGWMPFYFGWVALVLSGCSGSQSPSASPGHAPGQSATPGCNVQMPVAEDFLKTLPSSQRQELAEHCREGGDCFDRIRARLEEHGFAMSPHSLLEVYRRVTSELLESGTDSAH